MEVARDTFYRIYKSSEQSDAIYDIFEQLDFHPLSITLLATVAHQNRWDTSRLAREWKNRRTDVLRTDHNESLAAAIELSLDSPMFQELGPDARALLRTVAFFPQGIDENNLDRLFPAISNRDDIFDKFCVLSLTCRSNGFATMLAPLRDHLCPKDPGSSPLLCAIKECYFSRLVTDPHPYEPSFKETQWVTSEDVNIEHLLDVFTSIDTDVDGIWDACAGFLRYLYWHKPRSVVLGPKIEGLPDGHPRKPECLLALADVFISIGNHSESRRLFTCTLKLYGEWGYHLKVARILWYLANLSLVSNRCAEGIPQAKEASEIFERFNDTVGRVNCLQSLALLLAVDGQAGAAEEAASNAINLAFTDKPSPYNLCNHHHILGHIWLSRGGMEAAISHHEKAIRVASSLGLQEHQASILFCLVKLLLEEGRLDDAQVHLESLKLDTTNNVFRLCLTTVTRVCTWRRQGRFEEAESEVSRVFDLCQKVGVPVDVQDRWKTFLRGVEKKVNNPVSSG